MKTAAVYTVITKLLKTLNVKVFVLLFLLVVFMKAIINAYRLITITKLKKCYKKYLDKMLSEKPSDKEFRSLIQKKHIIVDLFKKARLEDRFTTYAEPIGYGFDPKRISLFDNLGLVAIIGSGDFGIGDFDIPGIILQYFEESIGIYKSRLKEAFNPIFWIETIIFLPQKFIEYLGVCESISKLVKIIKKIVNLIFGYK